MSTFLPIQAYIELGEISGWLSGSDEANQNALKGGSVSNGLSRLLHAVTDSVKWAYGINPDDPTLNATGLYLYALCGRYVQQAITSLNNQSISVATVTGPSNQSVNVGQNATFTIGVTSTFTYTIQWYRNGVLIPGATGLSYILSNAQLTDTGAQFSAIVTNAGGPAYSGVGVLTVSQTIVGYFTYSPTVDFNIDIDNHVDLFNYGTQYPITHNQPISIPLPSGMPSNQYMLIKVPAGESLKNTWFNTAFNNGFVGDVVLNGPQIFGGFTYYCSHQQVTMDVSQPLIIS